MTGGPRHPWACPRIGRTIARLQAKAALTARFATAQHTRKIHGRDSLRLLVHYGKGYSIPVVVYTIEQDDDTKGGA